MNIEVAGGRCHVYCVMFKLLELGVRERKNERAFSTTGLGPGTTARRKTVARSLRGFWTYLRKQFCNMLKKTG